MMLQQTPIDEFTDVPMHIPSYEQKIFKLPLIESHPISRGHVKSKNENRYTNNLPNIRMDLISRRLDPVPHSLTPRRNLNSDEKDDFALEIEYKLKLVLGNVNRAEELRSMDDSDEFDFEALLNQNKEKLKQKYKNEKEHINNLLEIKEEKKGPKSKSKTIKQGIRNESLYEKKIKYYRENSNENKYIHKKKYFIANKHEAERYKLVIKPKYYAMFVKPPHMSVPHAQIKASKSNLKDIKVEKIILEAATLKSENLFDNIQNFLENPSRGQYQTAMDCHKKSGMTLSELEDKLKQINEKLGITNEHDQEKTIQKLYNIENTMRYWKRVYVKSRRSIDRIDSNFDKYMDRIISLQEKNQDSLNELLEYQKLLLELKNLKQMMA